MKRVIESGEKIKHFKMADQFGKEFSSEAAAKEGKKILLSFHPLAWTGICTQQMEALDKLHEKFEAKGVIPLGVSVDAAPTKKAWGESMGIKKLRMLCDFWPHGALAKAMEIFIEDNGTSGRGNVVIGTDGTVEWSKVYQLSEMPDFEEVLANLK